MVLCPISLADRYILALALPWIFIFVQADGFKRISGILLCVIGISASLWIALNHSDLSDQYGFLDGAFQTTLAIRVAGDCS